MKRIVIALVALFVSLGIWAEKESIDFLPELANIERRSPTPTLLATHDGNILQIYSQMWIEGCKISVISSDGHTLYSEIVDLFPEQYHTFIIDGTGSNNYQLQVEFGGLKYKGYFEIE